MKEVTALTSERDSERYLPGGVRFRGFKLSEPARAVGTKARTSPSITLQGQCPGGEAPLLSVPSQTVTDVTTQPAASLLHTRPHGKVLPGATRCWGASQASLSSPPVSSTKGATAVWGTPFPGNPALLGESALMLPPLQVLRELLGPIKVRCVALALCRSRSPRRGATHADICGVPYRGAPTPHFLHCSHRQRNPKSHFSHLPPTCSSFCCCTPEHDTFSRFGVSKILPHSSLSGSSLSLLSGKLYFQPHVTT